VPNFRARIQSTFPGRDRKVLALGVIVSCPAGRWLVTALQRGLPRTARPSHRVHTLDRRLARQTPSADEARPVGERWARINTRTMRDGEVTDTAVIERTYNEPARGGDA